MTVPLVPDMFMEYRDFVIARHQVWEARQAGAPAPWTDHPVVRSRSFTNVFRILDYGTQFLMRELYGPGVPPETALARALLYRQTNSPEAWTAARDALGRYPEIADMTPDLADFWNSWRDLVGGEVFRPAYLVYPGSVKGADKVTTVVDRVARFMASPNARDFLEAVRLRSQVEALRSFNGIGDFVAMQVSTDYNYGVWSGDLENEMILPGPGARKGAGYLSPGYDPDRVITEVRNMWLDDPECPRLPGGRPVSLMDVQNTMCEFSKLVRYLGREPRADFTPAHPGPQPKPVLPEHWAH